MVVLPCSWFVSMDMALHLVCLIDPKGCESAPGEKAYTLECLFKPWVQVNQGGYDNRATGVAQEI